MNIKLNTAINYMFDWEKFVVFFQNNNIEIKNNSFSKVISIFFMNYLKKVFIKQDFIVTFYNDSVLDLVWIESIYELFIVSDIFILEEEFYKELLYIWKKWYNPYNIFYKLDYKYSDVPYYYDNWFLSKEIVSIGSSNYKNLISRKSFRTEYLNSEKSIDKDLLNLLKLSYWNIDYRKHIHVYDWSNISTVHKTVPWAWGFYNVILFSILDNWNIYYFDWCDNILLTKWVKYFDFLSNILTKSAIWSNHNDKYWAIQFLNINNTKWTIIAFWIIDKMFKKYYNKTLPFLLLEAWHIYQNLSIYSKDFNIWTLEIWSVLEENISNQINSNIENNFLKKLFEDKKLIYLNTMLLWYIKE